MIRCLAFSFLMTLMALSGLPHATQRPGDDLIAVGLDDDPRAATAPIAVPAPIVSPDASASGDAASCTSVTFTRSLKYGGDAMNVLDAASAQTTPGAKRPVVVFVTGDSFM